MHPVRVNLLKNRMYIFLNDAIEGNTKAYVNAIENACQDLISNFSCVAVLDKKRIVRQSDIDLLFDTVNLIYAYGADRIILVKKDNDALDFFRPYLFDFQSDVKVENAINIQEAENILENTRETTWAVQ